MSSFLGSYIYLACVSRVKVLMHLLVIPYSYDSFWYWSKISNQNLSVGCTVSQRPPFCFKQAIDFNSSINLDPILFVTLHRWCWCTGPGVLQFPWVARAALISIASSPVLTISCLFWLYGLNWPHHSEPLWFPVLVWTSLRCLPLTFWKLFS